MSCDTTLSTRLAFLCMSSEDVDDTSPGALTAIAAQARLSVAAYRKDPVAIFTASSRQGIPNIIVCRSCCDALSLLTNLLDQTDHVIPQTISPVPVDQVREPMKHRPLPGSQRPGREEMDGARDQWSSWLLIAISSNTGPLLSTQGRIRHCIQLPTTSSHLLTCCRLFHCCPPECCQLKRELRTIKNNCLASSSQFRHSCRLRDSVAMLLEGFFETDQPL